MAGHCIIEISIKQVTRLTENRSLVNAPNPRDIEELTKIITRAPTQGTAIVKIKRLLDAELAELMGEQKEEFNE